MRTIDDYRLLCCLPTIGWSIGTRGVPEVNLVRIAGPQVSDQLRRLEAEGRTVELDAGRWAKTADWEKAAA